MSYSYLNMQKIIFVGDFEVKDQSSSNPFHSLQTPP